MAKKVAEEKRMHLSEGEIAKFDLNQEKEKIRRFELNEIELKKTIVACKKQIAQLQMDMLSKEEKLLDELKVNTLQKHGKDRHEHMEFVQKLKKELGIGDDVKFGFNPDTGEVILD